MDLGLSSDSSLKLHQHEHNAVQKAGGVAEHCLASTANRDASFLAPLYVTHVGPVLEHCSSVWSLGCGDGQRLLESAQRRWTKSVRAVER